ncbi:MAG: DNA repair exonuclease [Planctomycetaceae bacterium]|nr:DNA repair exonuclease [Planctomycetaceae bacterium]
MRFLHAADVHLDSPLRGLERYEGAPKEAIREATRHAFEKLVALAISRQVDFVVLAGDLYDGDRDDFNIILFFNRQMLKLRDAGIPVFMISGNHDADNRMTTRLNPPDNVHRFGTDEPGTRVLDDLGVALHGQGFATGAVTTDLSAGYPAAVPGCFNIGLLHTCGTGAEGHAAYAPCTLDGLRSRQYQYWALGHVHLRHDLLASDPVVAFPGNVQGRHMRETGPKGCLIVDVNDSHEVTREFVPLDVFRWEVCRLDATEVTSAEELVDVFGASLNQQLQGADGLPLAVRVLVEGPSEVHPELASTPEQWAFEIRSRAMSIAPDDSSQPVWVEKVQFRTSIPASRDSSQEADGPLGELHQLIEELKQNPAGLEELTTELKTLQQKLKGVLLPDEVDEVFPTTPEQLQAALAAAGDMLLGRLQGQPEQTTD